MTAGFREPGADASNLRPPAESGAPRRQLIAILRGIDTPSAADAARVLVEAGISMIEVPMNSPDPLGSIVAMRQSAEETVADLEDDPGVDEPPIEPLIGAGTVLEPGQVAELARAGARIAVSPDCRPDVIEAAKAAGMLSIPGVMTPTEAFAAIRAGADGLKLFPASLVTAEGLSAMLAVLPNGTRTYAVGGVGPGEFETWLRAGVTGFGLGSALYKPGMRSWDLAGRAREIVEAYDAALEAIASEEP